MFSASTPSNPFIPQDPWLFFLSMTKEQSRNKFPIS
jgi:hypothetical protein